MIFASREKKLFFWKLSAHVSLARAVSHGHLAVSQGKALAGHIAIPKEIRVLLDREKRECLMGQQPLVSVSASHFISLKLSFLW